MHTILLIYLWIHKAHLVRSDHFKLRVTGSENFLALTKSHVLYTWEGWRSFSRLEHFLMHQLFLVSRFSEIEIYKRHTRKIKDFLSGKLMETTSYNSLMFPRAFIFSLQSYFKSFKLKNDVFLSFWWFSGFFLDAPNFAAKNEAKLLPSGWNRHHTILKKRTSSLAGKQTKVILTASQKSRNLLQAFWFCFVNSCSSLSKVIATWK